MKTRVLLPFAERFENQGEVLCSRAKSHLVDRKHGHRNARVFANGILLA